jgi:hypothetical protein
MDLHFHIQIPDGRAEPTTYPSELPVGQLLDNFIDDDRLRIEPRNPAEWQLIDENTRQTLDPDKSLHQNGVGEGHLLILLRRKPDVGGKGTVKLTTASVALRRCENGHYYDPKKHTQCPFCGVKIPNFNPFKKEGSASGETRPVYQPSNPRPGDDAVTRPALLVQDLTGIDPVVGWLIAVNGPDKGRDYRIRSERNAIGRSKDMQICIAGDDLISRERHAVITFAPQRNEFYLSPGDGRGLVYLKGEPVLGAEKLTAYDEILIGKTKLLFVPFCGDKFKWE